MHTVEHAVAVVLMIVAEMVLVGGQRGVRQQAGSRLGASSAREMERMVPVRIAPFAEVENFGCLGLARRREQEAVQGAGGTISIAMVRGQGQRSPRGLPAKRGVWRPSGIFMRAIASMRSSASLSAAYCGAMPSRSDKS